MNVSDVIHGRVASVDLRCADDKSLPDDVVSKSEVFLHGDEGGDLRLEIGGEVREVEGAAPRDRDTLRRIGIRGLPRLAWLAQTTPVRGPIDRVLIQVHEFPAALTWDEPMEIGVDDRLVDDLRKRLRRSVSVESAVKWLEERVLLPPREAAGPPRTLLSGSPTPDTGHKAAFRLHGAGFAVDVRRGSDHRLRATRVVTERRRIEGDERRPAVDWPVLPGGGCRPFRRTRVCEGVSPNCWRYNCVNRPQFQKPCAAAMSPMVAARSSVSASSASRARWSFRFLK